MCDLNIKNFNSDFVLISSNSEREILKVGRYLSESPHDFYEDVIITEKEILLKLSATFTLENEAAIRNYRTENNISKVATLKLPVYFSDTEDWKEVKSISGLDKDAYLKKLISAEIKFSMYGFLPGFTYFKGLPEELHIPRKSVPAKSVEAGSIAIGNHYLGLYSLESPGGWHVIGKTPLITLDMNQFPYASWKAGDRLEIEFIDEIDFDRIKKARLTVQNYNDER